MTNKDQQQEEEARGLLDRLGTERKKLEGRLDDIQKETHDAIVNVLMSRTLGPSEVARRVQYDRQHVARIAKKAGVPPLREATVVSRAKASAPKESSPAVAAPRPQVTQALPKPEPIDLTDISPEVAALSMERVRSLAASAETRQPQWVAEIREEYPDANELRLCYLIVDTGFRQGRKPPELADTPVPDASERPAGSEETSG